MTLTATAYLFNELSEEAKKKAIEKCRTWFVDHFEWWDSEFDYYKNEILAKEGFEVENGKHGPKMYFSGFSSQGDGASFEAGVDVYKFMKHHKLCNEYRSLAYWQRYDKLAWAKIKQSGNYYHPYTMSIDADFEIYATDYGNEESLERAEEQFEELCDFILERARSLAKDLYNDLEDQYEDMTSDDYVAEHIDINGFYFWHTGVPATAAAFED